MRSKNLKPSSKFVVSASSEESSSSERTMDDSVVIGTMIADNPSVSSGRGVGVHAEDETRQFFKGRKGMISLLFEPGRIWVEYSPNLFPKEEPKPKVAPDTSSLFDIVSREGSELDKVLGELGIRREKRLNSVVEKVQRAHQNVNREAVEQEALDLATHDLIRLDTQIRSSISQLSVAWKSAAEVLKLTAANRAELVQQHDAGKAREQFEKDAAATKQEVADEAKKAVDIVVAARNKLIQAYYAWGLSRADVGLALAGKYGEIVFPGDDASPVAEQIPTPPVDDDLTKEEVVHFRGKVLEMEKVLSRARDSINRTQQDKRFVDESDKLECQRSLLSLTLYFEAEVESERSLKEAYLELLTERDIVSDPARVKFLAQEARNRHSREAQRCSARAGVSIIWGGVGSLPDELDFCRDVEVENDKVENMWFAKRDEGWRASNSKSLAEDSEEEEVEELLPHTRHQTSPQEVVIFNEPLQVDVENKENENVASLSASNKKLSARLQQCLLAVKRKTLLNSKLESEMLELQSRLNAVTVELSCKNAEILTANNEFEQWKESLKKKKLETMAAN
ncbi:hypothetical protein GIB67_001241 [Kingdonia uniflora]|uniref:Uncharacterized protein n=1 Tax=Kingdonia uniflora TaxID=39325 RepID=A0A7J7LGM1_9MAGN|nr:hypothetical protein GIB67_001241 [Kingdonia uniflora]